MSIIAEIRTAKFGTYIIVNDDARTERGLPSFEVVATCGTYRAILPACPCGDDSDRVPCPLDYGHGKNLKGAADGCLGQATAGRSSTRLFCHDWHREKVERFAVAVAKTYGKGLRA
jgi:hypothetical protein